MIMKINYLFMMNYYQYQKNKVVHKKKNPLIYTKIKGFFHFAGKIDFVKSFMTAF